MDTIKNVIMKRDGLSSEDADLLIDEAKSAFDTYLTSGDTISAYNICEEYFGLEPDYIFEFIDMYQ